MMLNVLKQKICNLYRQNGYELGLYFLKNIGIAAICIVILNILTGTKISFSGVLEWVVSLPLFSIIVIIIRCTINLVHKIIPMNPSIGKIVFDFIIFALVMLTLGFLIGEMPMPESEILQTVIMVVFDAVYIAMIVFLMLSRKNESVEDAA